jgi:hypothetical protein
VMCAMAGPFGWGISTVRERNLISQIEWGQAIVQKD